MTTEVGMTLDLGVIVGAIVGLFLLRYIRKLARYNAERIRQKGYQPNPPKPLILTTQLTDPLVYRLDIPKGMLANQCSRCFDVYLIRTPPAIRKTAEPSNTWLCNDCEAKQKGVYR